MRKQIIISIIFILILPLNVCAEKISLACLEDFRPFQWSEKGEVRGIDADIIREVCKRLNIDVEFQPVPWKRALLYAENGIASGILAALYKEERKKFLYYTTQPVHVQKNIIMGRKGSGITVKNFDDLKGKSVGVVRGFSYGPEFDKYEGLRKIVCGDHIELIGVLDKKRIDVAMGSYMPLMFNAVPLGIQNNLEVLHVITEYPVYTVFSRKLGEQGKLLVQRFDMVLKQIKDEGMEQKIIDKYIK